MRELYWESQAHSNFFFSALDLAGKNDSYHQALFYVLGCCDDTRRNIKRLFDFKEDCIKPDALDEGWQTGGSLRVCRLAFNLWNGYVEPGREQMETPYELFDCSYSSYMMEGIKLRYPEYVRDLKATRPKPMER